MKNQKSEFRPMSEGLAALKLTLPILESGPSQTTEKSPSKNKKISGNIPARPTSKSLKFNEIANVEKPHFSFGAKTIQRTLFEYRPIILGLARIGIRKPRDVSKSLNHQSLQTACGEKWTERLSMLLLKMIFATTRMSEDEIADAMRSFDPSQASKEKSGLPVLPKKMIHPKKTTSTGAKKANNSPEIKPLVRPQGLSGKTRKPSIRSSPPVGSRIEPAQTKTIDHHSFVDKALEEIDHKRPAELVKMWRNCIDKLADSKKPDWHTDALRLMNGIEEKWSQRSIDKIEIGDDFTWPDTFAVAGKNKGLDFDQHEGMFSYLDYRVGRQNGLPSNVRKIILTRIFENKLPFVFAPVYMAEWGDPGSSRRLRKMAESLASFARNLKRRENEMFDEAIKAWEFDLNFLYEEYYLARHIFGWPRTDT